MVIGKISSFCRHCLTNLQVPQAFTIEYYLAIKEEAEDDDEVPVASWCCMLRLFFFEKTFRNPGVEGQYPAGCFNWTDSTQISCPSNTIVKHFCLGEGRRTQGQRHSWGLDRDGWRFALECQQKHVVWIELNIWKKNNLLFIILYAYISVSYVYTGSRAGYIYIHDWSFTFTAIPVDPFSNPVTHGVSKLLPQILPELSIRIH